VTIGLTVIVLFFTGAAMGAMPSNPVLGVVAPIIVPALLTWYLLMILAYGRRIIEMLAAFVFAPPVPQGRRTHSLIATILAWVMIIALAAVVIRPEFARLIASVLQQTAQVFSSTMNVFPQSTQPGIQPTPSASNVILYYYTILAFGAIIIVSFSLLFGAFRKAYMERHAVPGDMELRENALSAIQGTVANLEARQKYHETILECYRQMCEALSGKGHSIQPAQTAREFAENVSRKLDLRTDCVRGLSFLFEEARYSNHQIEDEKRGLALNYLRSLEHALVGVGARS